MAHRYDFNTRCNTCIHCEHPTTNPENEYGEFVCNDCIENAA